MLKKILIFDGSDFRNDLIKVIENYSNLNIDYDAIPNEEITTDKIKTFIKNNVTSDKYAMIFCHLRWFSENIESLDNLKKSDWFQPIFKITNRIGVSNGSNFRKEAEKLKLFNPPCYSHEEAAQYLRRVLNERSERQKNKK